MVIYRSFYEAIKNLSKKNQGEVWHAIFKLGFDFKEENLKGISKTVFTLIKPQIEANIRKYENAKKRKKLKAKREQNESKTIANDEQNVSKPIGNVNVNENGNVNANDNVNEKAESPFIHSIENTENFLKNDDTWHESVAMMQTQSAKTTEDVQAWLESFIKEQKAKGDFARPVPELKRHFVSWIKKQKKDERTGKKIGNLTEQSISAIHRAATDADNAAKQDDF